MIPAQNVVAEFLSPTNRENGDPVIVARKVVAWDGNGLPLVVGDACLLTCRDYADNRSYRFLGLRETLPTGTTLHVSAPVEGLDT